MYFSNERIFALILESQSSSLNPTRAFVRALDAKDGAMIWERVLISDTSIKGNSFELALNASQDYLSVLCNDSVYLLSAANGSISNSYSERKVLASHFTNGSTIAALVADNSAIQVVKLAQNAATETVPINDIQYSSESLAIAGANGSGNGSFLLSSLETSKAYVVCDAQVNALDFVDAFQRKDVTSINVVPHSFTDGALFNQGKPSVSVVRLGNADGSVVFAKFDACSDAPFTVLRAATASGAIVHASIVFAGASYSEPVLYVFEQAPGKVTSSAVRVDTAEAIDVPPLKQTSEPINYEVETRYLRVFGVPIIGNAESTPGSLQTNQLWRNLIVTEAGYVEFTSDKKVYWSRSEFEAMVESSVVVDVPSSSEQLRVLPSLSFVSRLIDQGFQVTRFVKNALGKLSYLLRELTADPAYTLESLFSGQHEVYAPDTMAPSSTPFQQLIVTLSNTFAGKLSQRVPFPFLHSNKDTFQEITGVLHGKILDTGAPLWTRALPLSAAARKIAASLDPETRGMAKSHLLVSRSRPFAGQPSQVVLVETTPASADLNQFHVSVSWVNTISGKVIRAMEYYTASPLAAITPVNKAASSLDEKQYLLTHAQYPGALPQFATVVPPASHFTGSFDTVYSTFTYNVQTSMEGIAGYGLGPKAIEQNAPVTRLTCEGQSCSNVQFFPTIVRWTHTLSAPVYTPESEEKGAPERLLAYTFHDSVSGKTASGGSVAAEKGVQALSDDSLLLKWNTENILAVVTGVPGARISFFERQREYTYFYAHKIAKTEPYKGFTVVVSTVEPQTNLVLLDTVTGKVVHLRSQPGSTGPCSVVLVDSWVSYTFWSDAGKRSEVAVFALYEGAIDRYVSHYPSILAFINYLSCPFTYYSFLPFAAMTSPLGARCLWLSSLHHCTLIPPLLQSFSKNPTFSQCPSSN